MSETQYDEADDHAMRQVQGAIVRAILPFTKLVPSWLVALALARCLRVVLRKAPAGTRAQLLPTLFDYLEGRTQPSAPASRLLWTPNNDDALN